MQLFTTERFMTEVARICAQRELASNMSAHETLTRLREAHGEAIQTGGSLLTDAMRRRGDSFERLLDQQLQRTRDHLSALNADDALRFCRDAETESDAQPLVAATRSAPLDPILLFELQAIHKAAQACGAAKTRAVDRQISMPGPFELLSNVSHHLVQALHPLSTDVGSREIVVARAAERAVSFLASATATATDGATTTP